jgi:hypothetical protein
MFMTPGGATSRLEPRAAVVVYERGTGQILTVHHFSAVPGVELPDDARLAEIALEAAGPYHAGDCGTLRVDPERLKPGVAYRVTRDGKRLIEAKDVPVELPAGRLNGA